MESLLDPSGIAALLTLTALEIVLGIDNIVFIAILAGRLPAEQQEAGRRVGLLLAMGTRIALLFSITLVMRLTEPLFSLFSHPFSGRDLILLVGGLFLLAKSTLEIHHSLEGDDHAREAKPGASTSFFGVVTQIMVLDIVFSLDSVITAIGLAEHLSIMVIAIVLAVGVMMFLAGAIGRFVMEHPTIRVLALSFLLLIGLSLIGEGISLHIPKGYIYFAMAFSTFVELVNLRFHKRSERPARD